MKCNLICFTFIAFFFSLSNSFSQFQISEIMFNPVSDAPEWIELYNSSNNDITNIDFFISDPVRTYLFTIPHSFAKQYIVLAKDTTLISQFHQIPAEALLIQTQIPALNNDKDSIYLRDADSTLIDTLFYNGNWSPKGITLERVSFLSPANSNENLRSSISIDSSTCGKANSVLNTSVKPDTVAGKINIYPNPFSTNGADGKSHCSIKYLLPHQQFKASLKIYNLNGSPIRTLASDDFFDNELNLTWDGANDSGFRMPVGVYPIILEVKDVKGEVNKVEKAVIVIGR